MAVTAIPINASAGSPAYSARQTRQAWSALMMAGPAPLRSRSGLRPGGAPTVSVTTTTWSVGPLSGIVDAAVASVQGPYLVASDATETGAVTAAHATWARKDILYLQVDDTDEDSTGQRRGRVLYLAGTAAASPSAPATPPRSLLIGTIDVPAVGGGSPSYTPSRIWAVAAGGIVPVSSQAEEDSLSAYDGMVIARPDQGVLKTRLSTTWRTIWQPPAAYTSSGITYPGGSSAISGDALRYQIDAVRNEVELHGGVQASTTFTTGGVVIATLPVGARPGALSYHAAPVAYTNPNEGTARVEIATNGQISLYSRTAVAWVRLHKIRFDLP
ncbi:hypothetical protein ACIA59_20115 [Micromonospora haikouensis]|uniref:hypothetical protein n=1 Tax=Micromonospora haikouensis TaxID=686309 RepID=UPI0037BCB41A